MSRQHFSFVCLVAVALAASPACALGDDETPAYRGPASLAETRFVRSIQADLGARFARASDAQRAGYVRYTEEDETGAISYAARRWTSDPTHPSQLWYDVHGHLLGADFARPIAAGRPRLWGVDPGRWIIFPDHIHYVARDAGGHVRYGRGTTIEAFAAAGGDPHHPTARTLVRMGKARTPADVLVVFEFPRIYDLIVWLAPNPAGAFATANPLVHPARHFPNPKSDVH
jgi:hypothetical protein